MLNKAKNIIFSIAIPFYKALFHTLKMHYLKKTSPVSSSLFFPLLVHISMTQEPITRSLQLL